MREKIITFFLLMWYLILILCHIGIRVNVVTAIILIISWWAITITIYQITFRRDEKKRKQREKEYREKYISDLIIEDKTYGRMNFELDSFEERIELIEINLPEFGNDTIDEFIIYEYHESKKDIYFRSLDYIYENSQKILEGLCEMAKDVYDSEDITINIEDIRNQLSVSWIEISLNDKDECIVEMHGGVNNDICDHIAEHGVTACINCTAEEFDYYSG